MAQGSQTSEIEGVNLSHNCENTRIQLGSQLVLVLHGLF